MPSAPWRPPPGVQGGGHWSSDDTNTPQYLNGFPQNLAYRTREPFITGVDEFYHVEDSPSRWIRTYQPMVPCFIASGDDDELSTGFGRDGNTHPQDYVRRTGATAPYVDGDPSPNLPQRPQFEFRVHDTAQCIWFMQDLLTVHGTFHARHSRLYLRNEINWERWPASLTTSGHPLPASPAPPLAEVPLIDGYYPPDPAFSSSSVNNVALAPVILDWLDETLCLSDHPQQVFCRRSGINRNIFRSTPLAVGFLAVVDLGDCPDMAHDAAWVYGYDTPCETVLSTEDVVLSMDAGSGEMLGLPLTTKAPNGKVIFSIGIPNDPGLIGTTIYMQAVVSDTDGVVADYLTNSQDATIEP